MGNGNSSMRGKSLVDDTNVVRLRPLVPPAIVMEEIPPLMAMAQQVAQDRHEIARILTGEDDRLLVVVGPCSIHDPVAALEYARGLVGVSKQHRDDLFIVMRTYFEKPRTTVGWKGLINDPNLDGSFEINRGLRLARRLLHDIVEMGLPVGVEFLDVFMPQYIADLVSWGAIGARTTESQGHREMASGLSMPIGFKNGTDGTVQVAVDAAVAARHSHSFSAITKEGLAAIAETSGNPFTHIILRGGTASTNYGEQSIAEAVAALAKSRLPERVVVDCSHGNSGKRHERQLTAALSLSIQLQKGSQHIAGVMVESNLHAGRQEIRPGVPLKYGVSVTDACIDWDSTVQVLEGLAYSVRERRKVKA